MSGPATAPWHVLEELTVADEDAVQLLWQPARRVHLRPFIGRAAGLADAAAELGIKKTAMSYWVHRLLDAGLIRVWGVERRGRHKLTLYRCPADRLIVSLRNAPLESYEAAFDDVSARWQPLTRRALGRSLERQMNWLRLVIEAAGPGGMTTHVHAAGANAPADDFLYAWGRLWLNADERESLRAELDAMWTRYSALSDKGRKAHPTLVHMVAVPERGG